MFGKTSKQFLVVALASIACGGLHPDAGAKSLGVHVKPGSKAKETLLVSGTNSPGSEAPSSEEIITTDANEKTTVKKEIEQLDGEITQSLEKITQYQNLKSNNKKIARLYTQQLKAERKNLTEKERELSGALRLKEELEEDKGL